MHPIFQQHPLSKEMVQTSVGAQPTPYHIYDGHAVLIGGTADLAAVKKLLHNERVVPVQTQSGRALMALWAVDEPVASHGAHTEMQVSFYVTHQPTAPVRDGEFAPLNVRWPPGKVLCLVVLPLSRMRASFTFPYSRGVSRNIGVIRSFDTAAVRPAQDEGDCGVR